MTDPSSPFTEDELMEYLRGSAPDILVKKIDEAARDDPTLRAEIALMRSLKPALADADIGNPPGEFGWRRLEADIKRETANSYRPPPDKSVYWRVAAVIFGVAVLGQGAYIATLPRAAGREASYQTASTTEEAFVLGVAFKPVATVSGINALLQEMDGRIIDGPGAIGLYRIAFPSSDALTAARTRLASSDLIDLVADE